MDRIIFSGEMKLLKHGEIIESKGHPTQSLYICLQGKINNNGPGTIFNEQP